jgi:hypothetical protein
MLLFVLDQLAQFAASRGRPAARGALYHVRNEVEAIEIVHHSPIEQRRGRALQDASGVTEPFW